MSKVEYTKKCDGPFAWESNDGRTELKTLGICNEVIEIEHEDGNPLESSVFRLFEGRVNCDGCVSKARKMIAQRERRMKNLRKEWRAKGNSNPKRNHSGSGRIF